MYNMNMLCLFYTGNKTPFGMIRYILSMEDTAQQKHDEAMPTIVPIMPFSMTTRPTIPCANFDRRIDPSRDKKWNNLGAWMLRKCHLYSVSRSFRVAGFWYEDLVGIHCYNLVHVSLWERRVNDGNNSKHSTCFKLWILRIGGTQEFSMPPRWWTRW